MIRLYESDGEYLIYPKKPTNQGGKDNGKNPNQKPQEEGSGCPI